MHSSQCDGKEPKDGGGCGESRNFTPMSGQGMKKPMQEKRITSMLGTGGLWGRQVRPEEDGV